MNMPRLAAHLAAAALLAAPWAVHAEVFHGGTALASSMVGSYAKPLSSSLPVNCRNGSVAGHRARVDQRGRVLHRARAVRSLPFLEWYAAAIRRFAGGTTFNRTRVDLRVGGAAGLPLFGEVPYSTAPNERIHSALRAPQTLPYLAAGNSPSSASGSSLLLDIGGAFARASLSDRPSGPSLGAVSQTALDHELAQLRDGMGRTRFMRQMSLGMHLRF